MVGGYDARTRGRWITRIQTPYRHTLSIHRITNTTNPPSPYSHILPSQHRSLPFYQVLTTTRAEIYDGMFHNGLREGEGKQTFGNFFGEAYECPAGPRHAGNGQCTFTGTFARGFIHGQGKLLCVDGRRYDGGWANGRRAGQGTQYYLRDGEEGEGSRLYIGGIDSLYRMRTYSGSWLDGEREGLGVMTYINGDAIEGNFRKGQPHGTVLYRFAQQPFTTGTFRALVYNNQPMNDKKSKGKKSMHDRSTPSSRSRQGEREKKGKSNKLRGDGSRGASRGTSRGGSPSSTRPDTANALTATEDGERPSTAGALAMVLRRNDMRGRDSL